MQFGKVVSFKDFSSFFVSIKKNITSIVFTLIFLIGFVFGIYSFKKISLISTFFEKALDSFINLRSEESFLNILIDSFLNDFTYLCLIFFFGASVLGLIFIPFVSLFCGMYYGGLASALYSLYALNGITYNVVFVLPFALFLSIVLTNSSCESLRFSMKLSSLTLSRTMNDSLYFDFKKYCNKYIIYSVLIVIIAFINALIAIYFNDCFAL